MFTYFVFKIEMFSSWNAVNTVIVEYFRCSYWLNCVFHVLFFVYLRINAVLTTAELYIKKLNFSCAKEKKPAVQLGQWGM